MRSPYFVLPAILLVGVLASSTPAKDELPPHALARLVDQRFYHGERLGSYAISHDGLRVVTRDRGGAADADKAIVWDGSTGAELVRWQIPGRGIASLDISPDGRKVALGWWSPETGHAVSLYDVDTGKFIRRLDEFDSPVGQVQFSLDGKHLHVSEGHLTLPACKPRVSCWDTATGKRVSVWTQPMIAPRETEKDYTSWTVLDGQLSADETIVYWLMAVEVQTPKGSVDLAKRYHVLRGCDAASNKQLFEFEAESWPITMSPDGKRAVFADAPGLVRDMTTGKLMPPMTDSPMGINIVALLPDPRFFLIDTNEGIVLFDQKDQKRLKKPGQLAMWPSWVKGHRISGDGKTWLAATSNSVILTALTTGKMRVDFAGHCMPLAALAFSPDGKKLRSRCEGERVCEWSLDPSPKAVRDSLARPSPTEDWLAFSADSRLLLSCNDAEEYRIRDARTGKERCVLQPRFKHVQTQLFSPSNDKILLLECDGQTPDCLEWFDTATGKRLGIELKTGCYGHPTFSADGRRLAWLDGDQRINVADADSGRMLPPVGGSILEHADNRRPCIPIALSSTGEIVAVSPRWRKDPDSRPPEPIHVFHVKSGKEIGRFFVHPQDEGKSDSATGLALSPDGRLLAVTEMGTTSVRVLEVASGQTRQLLNGHRSAIGALAFSPDSKLLASGSDDGAIYLWDLAGGRTKTNAKEMDMDNAACWEAFAQADAARPCEALAALLHRPDQAVAFLKDKLCRAPVVDEKRLKSLIADLDADAFEKREAASRELGQLGNQVDIALRQARKGDVSPEARRRIDELLEMLDTLTLQAGTLQALRALEALEHIGTPAAQKVLATLAEGAPEARLTQDAKASLKRLTPAVRP